MSDYLSLENTRTNFLQRELQATNVSIVSDLHVDECLWRHRTRGRHVDDSSGNRCTISGFEARYDSLGHGVSSRTRLAVQIPKGLIPSGDDGGDVMELGEET